MFKNNNHHEQKLFKRCNGYCVPAYEKCNGKCDNEQCFEEMSGKCLDPDKDRNDKEMALGIWQFKHCEGKCIPVEKVCHGSCGDSRKFCWDAKAGKCKSHQERDKVI